MLKFLPKFSKPFGEKYVNSGRIWCFGYHGNWPRPSEQQQQQHLSWASVVCLLDCSAAWRGL